MVRRGLGGLAALAMLATLSAGQPAYRQWAATPPMGWNSWDAYGTAVREQDVKANADYLAARLKPFGWQYIVVDIQWYEPNARGHDYDPAAQVTLDRYGRLLPAPNRFPSAAAGRGFKALADYVHARGLKFGIHIMRGIPRRAVALNLPVKGTRFRARDIVDQDNPCQWNPDMWGVDTTRPGAQAYYDSIAELYAAWGVDFIKADDMGSHLYQPAEIKAMHRAIVKTGRPMVLSLSPGPAPASEAPFLRKHAQLWRVSDDFWDDWELLRRQFDYARDWAGEIGRDNTWPDADMLPLGRLRMASNGGRGAPTRFTPDEQRTLLTLWCIIRSPLIFGGDLPSCDEATLALISNPEVLEVNQHSSGNRPALTRGDLVAWTAQAPGTADVYLAVFNLGETRQDVDLPWSDLGLEGRSWLARDLWRRADLGARPGLQTSLPAHGSALFRISPEP